MQCTYNVMPEQYTEQYMYILAISIYTNTSINVFGINTK